MAWNPTLDQTGARSAFATRYALDQGMGPGEPAPARPHPLRPHAALASRSLPGEASSAATRARPPPWPPPPHFPIGWLPGPGPRRSSGEAEPARRSSGEEGCAPSLSNALGRGEGGTPCTSLRCDRAAVEAAAAAAACGSERLAEAAPLLPEARCLEPGVSSVALVCRRFPCPLLHSPRTRRRNAPPFLGLGLGCGAGLGGPSVVALSLSQWFPVTERGSGLSRFAGGGVVLRDQETAFPPRARIRF